MVPRQNQLALAGPDALAATEQQPAATSDDQALPLDALRASTATAPANAKM